MSASREATPPTVVTRGPAARLPQQDDPQLPGPSECAGVGAKGVGVDVDEVVALGVDDVRWNSPSRRAQVAIVLKDETAPARPSRAPHLDQGAGGRGGVPATAPAG